MGFLERIVNWGTPVQRTEETLPGAAWGSSAFGDQVNSFITGLSPSGFSPAMADRVWAANRCIQLNSQQIAKMPLRFFGSSREPAWVANPDPVWYPNGIGDAVAAIVRSFYGWGDAFLYLTSQYADGFPAGWTVMDPSRITIEVVDGEKVYRVGSSRTILDKSRVVQITRDPTAGSLRGTPALRSYASQVLGLTIASDLANVMNASTAPKAVLKSSRKITAEQAEAIQQRWVERTAVRSGAPPVLPPDMNFETLAFSPRDTLVLEAQEMDARAIASAFGVPASFINLPLEGGLTYQSPEMLGEHWWRFELSPVAGFIQRALSNIMLPRGSWVEFDQSEAIQPTFKERVEAWTAAVAAGLVTAEEARVAVFKLPPQSPEDSIVDLSTPPSANASPADQTASVVELRPSQGASQ